MTIRPTHISALITGLLSGGIFLLVIVSGMGFLFMFAALLPVFLIRLGKSPVLAFQSGLAAAAVITLFSGEWPAGFSFLLFFAMPCWYFTKASLRIVQMQNAPAWYPMGHVILHLSLYACVLVAISVAYYTVQEGGITAAIHGKVRSSLADMPDEYGPMIATMAQDLSFLIFAMLAWMWAIGLYVHGWLANAILVRQNKAIRPNVAIQVFAMPGWALYLLGVAALASLIGSESMQFLGKSCFIILLLPYFFLGLALMHRLCADWPNRRFFLFFIYIMLIALLWVALAIAAVGLMHHVAQINKRLSSG